MTSYLNSARTLVWRNEDGGPGALDEIDPSTGGHVNREVEAEGFTNITEELRLRTDYTLLGLPSTLAAGTQWFDGRMHLQGGAEAAGDRSHPTAGTHGSVLPLGGGPPAAALRSGPAQ